MPRIWLQEARLSAGYLNRAKAAAVIPLSPEALGRHERGEREVSPADAVVYARGYGNGGVLVHYCAECPVGRAAGKRVTKRDFPFATLRLDRRLRRTCEIADLIGSIAEREAPCPETRQTYDAASRRLRDLEEAIADYTLAASAQGMEKSRARG